MVLCSAEDQTRGFMPDRQALNCCTCEALICSNYLMIWQYNKYTANTKVFVVVVLFLNYWLQIFLILVA